MATIDKDLSISFLFDFYGEMLTDIQKEAVEYYYNHDLSLAEIAEHSGITRQGVRDSIKRAERQLLEYEEKLGLYERFHRIQSGLGEVKNSAQRLLSENARVGNSPLIELEANRILNEVKKLSDES